MVEINLTLLVQIAHFIIAYILMRIFLWRPIINYLQEEEHHKNVLNEELQKQRTIVEQKELDLTTLKYEAQKVLTAQIPPLGPVIPLKRVPLKKFEVRLPSISPERMEHMVQSIAQKVKE